MDQYKKLKKKRNRDTEPVVEKTSKSIKVEEKKERKKLSRKKLLRPVDETDQLNLGARDTLVVAKNDSDQFDEEKVTKKPTKAGKSNRGREKKNHESLKDCEDLLENGGKTVQPEANQPSMDHGKTKKSSSKRGRDKKNHKSLEDCEDSLENEGKTVQSEAYQPSVDTGKTKKSSSSKKGRDKKNRESLKDCEDSLVDNGGKTVQPEAYQPSVANGKTNKSSSKKRKGHILPDIKRSTATNDYVDENDVFEISSGDDDTSKGMKKWITKYHESIPGLKVLQQRIDDYITAHEARLEHEKKEREAQAADGGWTVVVHHRGRKKTTDAETGVTVGSVAQTAVEDKMSKKKGKEAASDFYRFQRREAQRNEVLILQSKFEQDKKRIQQLRAARKFRPY